MKKNVGKKFRLMTLLASLTLVLWGGVIACSNGSDDDGTSVKLKGAFFESDDENADWIYCAEQLTETESGIWEGEITAVRGWENFGVEVNGTWHGAEEGLKDEIKDATLVKDGNKSFFWLATDKGGKSKVTVNLNKMTITVVNADPNDSNDDGSEDVEAVEFSYTYEASKISQTAASITITVTNITSTTDNAWEFWATTSASDNDEIKWKSGEGANAIYELTITDATKIAYVKEKGIAIKGSKGLNAEVKVTSTEPTATPPTDEDDDDDNDTEATEFSFSYKASDISEKATSITITVSKISGTATDWKFWATTSDSDSDEIKCKSGEGAAAIYELTITDATKIAYLKEKGIAIKGSKGLSATVTVTTDEGGTPANLPTWVGINGGFKSKDSEWEYTELKETDTKGIWSVTISNITYQWPNFQIQAGDPKKVYAGSATEWTKVEIDGDAIPLVESEKQNLGTTCWENNSGTTSANLKVTVDFTGDEPTIKIELVK